MAASHARRVALAVTIAFSSGALVAGVLYWAGFLHDQSSTAQANVPAYLGQETFSICVDNPSGKFDNSEVVTAVQEAIDYGRKTPAWVGSYLEDAKIDVEQGCPAPPRAEDEPRFAAQPQSKFSIFVFVLDESESSRPGYALDEKGYIPLWGIESGPNRFGEGDEFVTYGIFLNTTDVSDVEGLAGAIGAAYGRPPHALSFEECETPNPGATDQSSGCDDGDFVDSDELNPDAPSR